MKLNRLLHSLFALSTSTSLLRAQPQPVAFDWFEYSGQDSVERTTSATEYHNPVLAGFYPDPSLCRVGDDYYLVNSTFAYFPGIPIFHSRDLVHWQQLGNVIDRPDQLRYKRLGVSAGIYAPSIRYHNGAFYVVCTMVEANGNFVVTATNAAGPWSKPVELGFEGIDPSLFFDEDRRAWVVNNGAPEGKTLYNGHRAIWIQEFDAAAKKMVGGRKVLVNGGVDISKRPIWIEGPHLYKRDGWYYLCCAEGGTGPEHSEVSFRSRNVEGPFVPWDQNPILTQRGLDPNSPGAVTCTGHADLVVGPDDNWWAVFLGVRPYDGRFSPMGRETFLLPVRWTDDGWPIILPKGERVPLAGKSPATAALPPSTAVPLSGNFTWRDDFKEPALPPLWIMLRTPEETWWKLNPAAGQVTIMPRPDLLSGSGNPSFLARRVQHARFTASTSLDVPKEPGISAGLAIFQNERHHYFLAVRSDGNALTVYLERAKGRRGEMAGMVRVPPASKMKFRVVGNDAKCAFEYAADADAWKTLVADADATLLTTDVAGGFVGATVGMHARMDSGEKPVPSASAQKMADPPAPSQPITATIDASKTGPPISPYVYGQFLEHIGNLIYGSLWSEMLDDRKFYYAVAPKPADEPSSGQGGFGGFGGGRRRGVGPGRWNPIGPVDSVVMDPNNPFVGDHTPLIRLDGAEARGIRQTGVNFIQGAIYNGRIQLAGDPTAKVSVSIVWGTNADAPRQVVPLGKLGKHYKKFTFSSKADNSGPAQFEISGTGAGSFHVGAVSLMPADNLDGFRPDAIAVLKSLRSGVYRFPGGNYASAFEWRNAIGDPDKRPPTYDPVWRALQPNDIGADEFMTMCQLLGVEPYITVNAGTGDAWSAAEYVEYANGEVSTPMGKERAANGHPEPYHVKFWGIGNEMWGISYQYGAMKLNQFEYKHNQFAKAMKKMDPTIKLIACGAMPDTMTGSKESLSLGNNLVPPYLSPADWTGGLLLNCFDNIDLLSDHFYNFGATHFSLAEGRQVPNDTNEPVTDWMRRPANHIRIKYEEYKEYEKLIPELVTHPKPLNIDEWAYMGGRYPVYPSYAWVFHEMFRHSDLFQMAAYTFATSLLAHNGTNVSLNANGLVFKIYHDHFGSIPVEVSGNSPQPKPTDPPGGEQPVVNAGSDTFPVDVVAAWTDDHRALTVAVLNPTDAEQPLKLNIMGAALSGNGTLWRLASAASNGQDPSISNSPVDSIPDSLTLPRFSVSIYELPMR